MIAIWQRELATVRGYLGEALALAGHTDLGGIRDEHDLDNANKVQMDGWEMLRIRFGQAEFRSGVCRREDRVAEVFSEWSSVPLAAYDRGLRRVESLAASGQKAAQQRHRERALTRAADAIRVVEDLAAKLERLSSREAA